MICFLCLGDTIVLLLTSLKNSQKKHCSSFIRQWKTEHRKNRHFCVFDISYPLYVTHYPLIYWQMSWATTHKDLPVNTNVFVAVCIFFLAIGIAYASLKLYDEPAREWLKQKLFTNWQSAPK